MLVDSQQILLPNPKPRPQKLFLWKMEGIRGLGQLTPTESTSAELGSYPSSLVAWLCLQGPLGEETGQRQDSFTSCATAAAAGGSSTGKKGQQKEPGASSAQALGTLPSSSM